MLPPFIWMFINGFNFIRYNKAGDVTRSAAMMYVKNTDMMSLTTQRIVERVGCDGVDRRLAEPRAIGYTTESSPRLYAVESSQR